VRIERVTPLDNPAVNGPWICNKGRDLAQILERPRALAPMIEGRACALDEALDRARQLIDAAQHAVALLSSWGSNEELAAFDAALGTRVVAYAKEDSVAAPGEPIEDDILIRRDKNPNGTAARAQFPSLDATATLPAHTDLVLVWGAGFDFARVPAGARVVVLATWHAAEHERADVFIPVSAQTERSGHYTNFEGVVSAFEPCFARPAEVADAADVFATFARS
jgi:NADH-quinone oxidoreductase subunit G